MTIIAYKNGVMASDSQIQQGSTRAGAGKKIMKTRDGFLAGAAGEYGQIRKYLRWADSDKSEPIEGLENFEGLLIYPNQRVVTYDGTGEPMEIMADFYALGSGSEVALGALEQGATPQEAVRAAIKWSTSCGGKVQVVTL